MIDNAAAEIIRAQRERIEELEEELLALRQIDDATIAVLRHAYRLTPSEAAIVARIHKGRGKTVSRGLVYDALNTDAEIKIVDVLMCKCRRKLPQSAWIVTDWAVGYHLAPEAVAAIDDLIAAQVAPLPRNGGDHVQTA